MFNVPVLHSERLILRGFETRDEAPYIEMLSDNDEVTRFLGDGKPLTPPDAWRQLAMIIGHWELRGFGLWAVEERSSGRLLGRIGCHEPYGWPAFEVGYTLGRHGWGHGYAREGVALALKYARETLGRDEIISIIRPANSPSIRLAQSFGAQKAETIEFFGAPSDIYRYPLQLPG